MKISFVAFGLCRSVTFNRESAFTKYSFDGHTQCKILRSRRSIAIEAWNEEKHSWIAQTVFFEALKYRRRKSDYIQLMLDKFNLRPRKSLG